MLIPQEWYEKNKENITEADIAALGIEVSIDSKKYPEIHQGDRKGKLKEIIKLCRGVAG